VLNECRRPVVIVQVVCPCVAMEMGEALCHIAKVFVLCDEKFIHFEYHIIAGEGTSKEREGIQGL